MLRFLWIKALPALRATATLLAFGACGLAHASIGLTELPATAGEGRVTVFYPSDAPAQALTRGPATLPLALNGAPRKGNGRLIVVSHGSGGSPWVHAELARTLVEAGFIVAFPWHLGDNMLDDAHPGPDSWALRPAEVSRTIDRVAREPRFAPLFAIDKVGLYGMSAGGHTALSLAGGRWSPAGFERHCEAHIGEDFQACVGLITQLTGSPLDGLRKTVALAVIRHRFDDATPRADSDPRIAAIVAAVPFAADFDMTSLAAPRLPLGLVTAQQDRWLMPRFHAERVLQVCSRCERVADLPNGGHGALLAPLPPHLIGLVGDLLNDPPGFDRASAVAEVDAKVTAFFQRHLLP